MPILEDSRLSATRICTDLPRIQWWLAKMKACAERQRIVHLCKSREPGTLIPEIEGVISDWNSAILQGFRGIVDGARHIPFSSACLAL